METLLDTERRVRNLHLRRAKGQTIRTGEVARTYRRKLEDKAQELAIRYLPDDEQSRETHEEIAISRGIQVAIEDRTDDYETVKDSVIKTMREYFESVPRTPDPQ